MLQVNDDLLLLPMAVNKCGYPVATVWSGHFAVFLISDWCGSTCIRLARLLTMMLYVSNL